MLLTCQGAQNKVKRAAKSIVQLFSHVYIYTLGRINVKTKTRKLGTFSIQILRLSQNRSYRPMVSST